MTVIVMCDSRTKGMFAHSCPGKETVSGEHAEYVVTKVTDNINFSVMAKRCSRLTRRKPW